MLKKASPDLLGAGAYGENQENRGWPFLTSPFSPVNPSDLLFHLLPVSGLALAGGWADRLVLWVPMMAMAALMLRTQAEGRR
jgi:hypothetical protein